MRAAALLAVLAATADAWVSSGPTHTSALLLPLLRAPGLLVPVLLAASADACVRIEAGPDDDMEELFSFWVQYHVYSKLIVAKGSAQARVYGGYHDTFAYSLSATAPEVESDACSYDDWASCGTVVYGDSPWNSVVYDHTGRCLTEGCVAFYGGSSSASRLVDNCAEEVRAYYFPEDDEGMDAGTAAGIGVGVAVGVLVCGCLAWRRHKRRRDGLAMVTQHQGRVSAARARPKPKPKPKQVAWSATTNKTTTKQVAWASTATTATRVQPTPGPILAAAPAPAIPTASAIPMAVAVPQNVPTAELPMAQALP